jgi:hypothetical protein
MGIVERLIAKVSGKQESPEERRKRIIGEYVNACSRYAKRTLVDMSVLPHPKEEIQAAMLWLMETNQTARQVFAPIYLGTSIYQRGVDGGDSLALIQQAMGEFQALKETLQSRGIL